LIKKAPFVLWQIVQFPFLLGLFLYTKAFMDKSVNSWVISGHRGRIKSDNASALFDYISRQTDQPIIWIYQRKPAADSGLNLDNSAQRNSFRARVILARAPVLIYSHGEDDPDCLVILLRRLLGKRIYIGHGANIVKRGTMHPDNIAKQGWLRGLVMSWLATDYDFLLCSSDEEKHYWDANKPKRSHRHFLGGGAPRLDKILPLTQSEPARKIVWVPTFRDTKKANRLLLRNLQVLAGSEKLQSWLDEKDFQLAIGCHINTEFNALSLAQRSRRVTVFQPDQLWHELSTAACIITDYSSILVDWLLFDRPAIFFAFDLNDYKKIRGFHWKYEDYIYGELVTNLQDFLDLITSERWMNTEHNEYLRLKLKDRFFPTIVKDNARSHYEKICTLTGLPTKYRKVGQGFKIGSSRHSATDPS